MADNTKSNLLDLEALAPTPTEIKLPDGRTVAVQPPKMQDTLKLSILGKQMARIDELTDDETAQLDADIDTAIKKMIPELEGFDLSTPQKLGVINLLAEMGVPASAKDLKAAGITTGKGGTEGDPKAEVPSS